MTLGSTRITKGVCSPQAPMDRDHPLLMHALDTTATVRLFGFDSAYIAHGRFEPRIQTILPTRNSLVFNFLTVYSFSLPYPPIPLLFSPCLLFRIHQTKCLPLQCLRTLSRIMLLPRLTRCLPPSIIARPTLDPSRLRPICLSIIPVHLQ